MLRLQLKPNRWSCSITSLAMTLCVPVQELINELGHDGGEIVFPDLPEPMCRRGFHSQELVHLAWRRGFCTTAFELFPGIAPTKGEGLIPVYFGDEQANWERFTEIIKTTSGILEGRGLHCRHAVHYGYGHIWDPDGRQYQYSRQACEQHGFFHNRALIITRREYR